MLTTVIIGTLIHRSRNGNSLLVIVFGCLVLLISLARLIVTNGGYCNFIVNSILEGNAYFNLKEDFAFTPICVSHASNTSAIDEIREVINQIVRNDHSLVDHHHALQVYGPAARISTRISPGHELTDYIKKCRRILYRATDRPPDQLRPAEGTLGEHLYNNHLLYALKNEACVLDISCVKQGKMHDFGRREMSRIHSVLRKWQNDRKLNPNGLRIHFNPESAVRCGGGLEPYFYKFVGMLALIENWITAYNMGVRPGALDFMYLDNDVAFTNLSPSRDWWAGGRRYIREQLGGASSYLILNSDYYVYDAGSPYGILPVNTGVMIGYIDSIRAAYDILGIVVRLLLLPHKEEYIHSLKYWDTDQGAFTYVLDKYYGMKFNRIGRNDSGIILRSKISRATELFLLDPKELAPVSREFLPRPAGHEDVEWSPGDWMVHLTPGLPQYKVQTWNHICTMEQHSSLCELSRWQRTL